ncbi:MAG: Fur family transcriptional regulator [Dehalococcoidia bacterium]
MTHHGKVLDKLKESEYRLTPQRVMVISAMAEHPGHIGVDDIFREVHRLYPYIDVATVYHTLQLLKRLHLVTELDVGGFARYELVEADRHHHMVCSECGNAFDFSPRYLETFRKTLTKEFGFQPDLEHFDIGGLCSDCAGKGRPPPAMGT